MNMEASNEVRVKDEPIYYSQSISDTRKATLSNNKPNKITNNEISREDISSDDQPNKRKRQSMKAKEEPIDNEMQTSSKSQIGSTSEDVEIKAEKEEKFSTREEFANKISIAFLNEETNTNKPITSNNEIKSPRNTKSK